MKGSNFLFQNLIMGVLRRMGERVASRPRGAGLVQ